MLQADVRQCASFVIRRWSSSAVASPGGCRRARPWPPTRQRRRLARRRSADPRRRARSRLRPAAADRGRARPRRGRRAVRRRHGCTSSARSMPRPCDCYQRALRCDPQSATIARAIIPVAVRLKRYAEAVRYALKAVELEDADPLLLRRLGVYLTEEGDWARAVDALREGAGRARQGQGNGRRHPPADGNGPPLPSHGEVQAGGRVFRPRALRHRPSRRVRARRAAQEGAAGRAGPDLPAHGRVLSGGRPAGGGAWPPSRRPTKSRPTRRCGSSTWPASTPRPASRPRRWPRWRPCFAEHLADEGMAPYETLADVLEAARQEGRTARPAGKAPRRRAGQRAAGLLPGRAVSRGRQARQGRIALPRTAQDQADARRLPQPGRDLSAGASGSTPCWPSWARRWRRPACWTSWAPRRRPISGDAEAMRGDRRGRAEQAARRDPDKFGYGDAAGRGPAGAGGEAVRRRPASSSTLAAGRQARSKPAEVLAWSGAWAC